VSRRHSTPPPDRLPPHSVEAEQGVLGCLMLNPKECIDLVTDALPGPQAFYDVRHAVIYETALAMWNGNQYIDLITFSQRLRDKQQLECVGGIAYLSLLPDTVPSAANLEFYLAIVRDKYRLRQMLAATADTEDEIYGSDQPADVILDRAESRVLAANTEAESSAIVTMQAGLQAVLATVETAMEHRNKGLMVGLPTGMSFWDKRCGGMEKGEVTLIGALPGMGKTALLCCLMLNWLRMGKRVGMLSMEMSSHQIILRMLCAAARANYNQIHSGLPSRRDKAALVEAVGGLKDSAFFIDDTPSLTPEGVQKRARRLVERHQVEVIVGDHTQLIAASRVGMDVLEQAKQAAAAVKNVAKWHGIPVVFAAQLNKESDKSGRGRPRMTDIYGSMFWMAAAGQIGILQHDKKESEEAGYAEDSGFKCIVMDVVKQRNGPPGPVKFLFNGPCMRFDDWNAGTGSEASGQRKRGQMGAEEGEL
jgi:replicative DNA helicase